MFLSKLHVALDVPPLGLRAKLSSEDSVPDLIWVSKNSSALENPVFKRVPFRLDRRRVLEVEELVGGLGERTEVKFT